MSFQDFRISFMNFYISKAYIVTPNSAIDFLNSFEEVRYSTMQRYSSTHVIALPTSHIDTENYIKEISMQKSVEGEKYCKNMSNLFQSIVNAYRYPKSVDNFSIAIRKWD